MFFKRNNGAKKKSTYGDLKIILDIRSSSVGGAIIFQQKDAPADIKYTTRKRVYFENKQDSNNFVERLMLVLNNVLDDLVNIGVRQASTSLSRNNNRIDEIICIMASPWYHSNIKNISIQKEEGVRFTNEFLKKIIKRNKKHPPIPEDQVVIDSKILSAYFNGYETPDPINKTAKKIDLTFFTSTISRATHTEIKELIRSRFNPRRIKFYSHPVAIISAIKNLYHSQANFLVIDIGGETTDMGLFRNSVLQSLLTIPHGLHYFIRVLEKECSFDKHTAESHLNMLYGGQLDNKCTKNIKTIVKKTEQSWLEAIKNAVDTEWQGEQIPPTIFVTVDDNADSLFRNILTSRDGYTKTLGINREPLLHIISDKNTKALCRHSDGATHDSLLTVFSYFSSLIK